MHPRRSAIQLSGRECNAHAPEERMQWDIDAGCKLRRHVFTIQRNHLRSRVRKIVREEAATWAEAVAGIRHVDVDLLDLHLQHVPRLSLCDFDWTSQNMT